VTQDCSCNNVQPEKSLSEGLFAIARSCSLQPDTAKILEFKTTSIPINLNDSKCSFYFRMQSVKKNLKRDVAWNFRLSMLSKELDMTYAGGPAWRHKPEWKYFERSQFSRTVSRTLTNNITRK